MLGHHTCNLEPTSGIVDSIGQLRIPRQQILEERGQRRRRPVDFDRDFEAGALHRRDRQRD